MKWEKEIRKKFWVDETSELHKRYEAFIRTTLSDQRREIMNQIYQEVSRIGRNTTPVITSLNESGQFIVKIEDFADTNQLVIFKEDPINKILKELTK